MSVAEAGADGEGVDTAGRPDGPSDGSMARDGVLNIVGALFSQVCNFGVVFALAQMLGEAAVGGYSQTFAWRALLLLLCGLGMRVAMTKFVAASIATEDHAGLHGSVRLGVWSTAIVSTVAAVGLYVAAEPLAMLVDDAALADPFRLAAVSLPFLVIMTTALAATQGFSTMRAFAGVGLILEPGLRLVLTVVALVIGLGLVGAMGALAVASIVAAVAALLALRRLLRTRPTDTVELRVREVAAFSGYSWVASIANQGLLWADIVILGVLVSSEQVGVYQVATRVVLLSLFVVTPLTASMAPRVTDLWERGLREQLGVRYIDVTSWTWRLSLPVLAVIAAVPDSVLRIFGEGFASGRTVALVLLVGALAETLAAPSAVVLNQIGRNGLNMTVNLAALALNIVGNLVLVPRMGIAGAAWAWTAALVLPGLVRVVAVRYIATDRWPWSRQHAAALLAAAAATLAARGVASFPQLTWYGQLLLATAVVVAVYIGLLLPTGGLTLGELAVALRRVPGGPQLLQRMRTRGLEQPEHDLELRELISPHRLDVLVRAELFRLARAHPVLVRRDPERFVQLARDTDYHTWFREVAAHAIGIDPADTVAVEEGFSARVRRSLDLLAAWEDRGGFDHRYPVTVRRLPAGTPLDGKTHAADRYVPVDGGHRLALLWLDGHETLPARWFRLDPEGALRGNTTRLVTALGWSRAQHVGFLAQGMLPPGHADHVSTLDELVEALETAGSVERDQVSAWAGLVADPAAQVDVGPPDSDLSD